MIELLQKPWPRLVAIAALIAGFLAAASFTRALDASELAPGEILVSGKFGTIPVVEFAPPLPLDMTGHEELIIGTGTAVMEGDPVVLSISAFNGRDGTRLAGAAVPQVLFATAEDLGEALRQALQGAQHGSRILITEPYVGTGTRQTLVSVVDVLPTTAQGEDMTLAGENPDSGVGDGRVTVAVSGGVPQISLADGAAPAGSLKITQLIRGEGAQIVPGQTLVVQYAAFAWSGLTPVESTWETGVPAVLELDTAFPGVRAGLVDQPIGSRVLLEIPPEDGIGTDTLLMVVDILGAS